MWRLLPFDRTGSLTLHTQNALKTYYYSNLDQNIFITLVLNILMNLNIDS